MNTDVDDGLATPLDTESIMRDVRQQILGRRLPGQALGPQSGDDLPDQFYDHLYQAGLAAGRLGVKLDVIESQAPLIGPLINRLRRALHRLVIFYVNQLADQQVELYGHLLKALGLLRVGALGDGEKGEPDAALWMSDFEAVRGDRATIRDVYASYRLLLERDPDEAGLSYWGNLVRNHFVTRAYLVDSFLSSGEFMALQTARNEPQLVELPDYGMYVRLNDNFIGAVIAREKRYEPHVTNVLRGLLKQGGTFVDVGANIGYFTLLAASVVGPNGRVVAFEPNPANCELLRRSIAANGFEGIVELHPVAVAEAPQTLRFVTAGVDSNGRIIGPGEAMTEATADLPTIQAVALDDALRDCPRVDVIKMDVEGAEARVWQGMQAVVRRHKPAIVFEFSPTLLQRMSAVAPEAFLEALRADYDLFTISPAGHTPAEPDSVEGIIEQHSVSGLTHRDILARPRR